MPRARLPLIVLAPHGPAAGCGNAALVQPQGDLSRRHAGGVVAEDAAHHLGLGLVDRAIAAHRLAVGVKPLHDIVAIGVAAARLAMLHPTPQTAPHLVRQILEEQRVHRALQPDMQFADLALGEGNDLDAGEAQPLEDGGYVLLVAAQPVERLGYDDIEPAIPRSGE